MNRALLITVVLVIGFLGGMNPGLLLGITIPGILFFGSLAIISLQPEEDAKFLTNIFLIAFTLRAVVGTAIYLLNLVDFFAGDSYTYDAFAWIVAQGWSGGSDQSFHYMSILGAWAHPGYIYFLAALYYMMGHQFLACTAINWIVGSLTVFFIFLIAKKMFDRRVAVYSAIFAAVMPGFVIWQSQLMKDPIIIFCLCVCVYSVMNLQERFNLFWGLIWMATLVVLFYFRIYNFYVMGAASAIALILGQRIGLVPMMFIGVILFGGFALVAQKSGFSAHVSETQDKQLGKGGDIFLKLDNLRKGQTGVGIKGKVGSSFLEGVDISTPEKAVKFLPLGVIYILLAPFPWMIINLRQAITLPEMLVWWYLIPSLIRGVIYGIKERFTYVSTPLFFSIGLTLVYALFQGNIGTAYRQRSQFFIFFFIFISAGLLLKKIKRDEASH